MTSDAGIRPIRDEDGAVGRYRDVARPKPTRAFVLRGRRFRRRRFRREEQAELELDPRTLGLRSQRVDLARAGIRAQQATVEVLAEHAALVHRDTRGSARAESRPGRCDARIVLVPMRGPRVLSGTSIGIPSARSVGREVAVIRAFHAPQRATGLVPVVVVVALEDVAVRVERDLVVVAEVVREDRETRAVAVHAQDEPTGPDSAVVGQETRRVVRVVGTAVAIDRTRAQIPTGRVAHDVGSGVPRREPQRHVGPEHDTVHAVIVIVAAEARQERRAHVGLPVLVRVVVDVHVRRTRHEDARAEHADPERNDEIGILDEDLRARCERVALRIGQDNDALSARVLASRIAPAPLAVVDALGDPHSSVDVDVDRGRVVELRRLGPQLHRHAGRHVELRGKVLRRDRRSARLRQAAEVLTGGGEGGEQDRNEGRARHRDEENSGSDPVENSRALAGPLVALMP